MKKLIPSLLVVCLFAPYPGCGPARYEFEGPTFEGPTSDSPASANFEQILRLGTREYIASTLSEIFGADSIPAVKIAIEDLVRTQLSPFGGGPCDRYAEECPVNPNTGIVDPAGESQASVVPAATTSRMALVIRVCDALVSQDDAVRFAAGSVEGEVTALPSDNQIGAAFELFHTGRPVTPKVFEALSSLVQAAEESGDVIEAWRFLFHALCSSPSWQVP